MFKKKMLQIKVDSLIMEAELLNKQIHNYSGLVQVGTYSTEDVQPRIDEIESRLVEIDVEQALLLDELAAIGE